MLVNKAGNPPINDLGVELPCPPSLPLQTADEPATFALLHRLTADTLLEQSYEISCYRSASP